MVSFLDKGSNKALRNPARRHSKALKMETNGPRDLKLGLNWSLENPPSDQRCTQKLFFQNRGLKGLHFWQSDGVPGSGGPLVKKGDHLDPDFGKIISGNIFNHKEDTLGIILSPISGL